MSTWRDKTPLHMHMIELDNVPQSQKISQLSHLCYISVCTVSAILSRGGKLSGPSGFCPLCRGTLLVAM
ncbi:hypothetical protein B7P43_G18167 [Cryptotermes secundus]|uniref:Uncharacterized protein n=1 Tax=Cryptotermes secundus TaxID=105785 RepID=A0A2J7QR11_9NEOP|nr:hypothetical protein B7P43_G18167 [Cryptotermes secundus]